MLEIHPNPTHSTHHHITPLHSHIHDLQYFHPITQQASAKFLSSVIDSEHDPNLTDSLIPAWLEQSRQRHGALSPTEFLSQRTGKPHNYYLEYTVRHTEIPYVEPTLCISSHEPHYLVPGLPLTLLHHTNYSAVTLIHCIPFLEQFLDKNLLLDYYAALNINFTFTSPANFLHHIQKVNEAGYIKTRDILAPLDFTPSPHRFDAAIKALKRLHLLNDDFPTSSDRTSIFHYLNQHQPATDARGVTEWNALCTDFPILNLADLPASKELAALIPKEIQREHNIVPHTSLTRNVTILTTYPFSKTLLQDIEDAIPDSPKLTLVLASRDAIGKQRSLNDVKANRKILHSEFSDIEQTTQTQEIKISADDLENADAANTFRALRGIILEANQLGASDVHISNGYPYLEIRFRCNGTLIPDPQEEHQIPRALFEPLKRHIQTQAKIDTQHSEIGQDGRFTFINEQSNQTYDVRLNVTPTITGGNISVRLQNRHSKLQTFEDLKYPSYTRRLIERCTTQSSGLLLICGPMGSGKTTTIAAALLNLDRQKLKIVTAENPVEIRIPGVDQTEITPQTTLKTNDTTLANSFPIFLRDLLRRDTDITLIGEIRDYETAFEAIRTSATGQIVLSTLHVDNAYLAPARLLNFNIKPWDISYVVHGVICQRLLPILCPHCTTDDKRPLSDLIKLYGIPKEFQEPTTRFKISKGCPHCNHSGFGERTIISEGYKMTRPIQDAIQNHNASPTLIEAEMLAQSAEEKDGTKTLYHEALSLAVRGKTSLAVAARVRPRVD